MTWEPGRDPTYQEKIEIVRSYAPGYRTMIETGLYNGHGTGMEMLDLIDRYIALDWDEQNCSTAREGCRRLGRLSEIAHGDSGEWMPLILAGGSELVGVDEPALFWLDAHTNLEVGDTEQSCPLLAELEAILDWTHAGASTVLIDDVRLFGTQGFPTETEVIARSHAWAHVKSEADILRFTP